jgi:hypothetical protein
VSRRALPALLGLLLPLAAAAQDRCVTQYEAEQARIQREYAEQRPAAGDKAAAAAAFKKMHGQLEAAAKKADDCRRADKPKPTPGMIAERDRCLAAITKRGEDIEKRYGGKIMTKADQTARRGEEDRLAQDRNACNR